MTHPTHSLGRYHTVEDAIPIAINKDGVLITNPEWVDAPFEEVIAHIRDQTSFEMRTSSNTTIQFPVSKTGSYHRPPWGSFWSCDGKRYGTASLFLIPDPDDVGYYMETGNDLEVVMDLPDASFLRHGIDRDWIWSRESGDRILHGTKEEVIWAIAFGFFNQLDACPENEYTLRAFLHQHLL